MRCGICQSGTSCPVHDRPVVVEHADGYEFTSLAPVLTNPRRTYVYAVVDPEFPDCPIDVFATRDGANAFLRSAEAEHWPDLVVEELEAMES